MSAKEKQRLRIKFSRGDEVKYISHLDLMRFWERALRRAEVPLAYSEGFSPHPRISLAAPLPVGTTSEAELMDIFLQKRISLHSFMQTIGQQLSSGVDISETKEVPLRVPSLQSQLRYAEYYVEVKADKKPEEVQQALYALLEAESLPWYHVRDTEVRHYDLRALIDDIWLITWQDSQCALGMRLRTDNRGTGRPEQVTAALGLSHHPDRIHRTGLILAGNEH